MENLSIFTVVNALSWAGMLVALVAAVLMGRRYYRTRSTPMALLALALSLAYLWRRRADGLVTAVMPLVVLLLAFPGRSVFVELTNQVTNRPTRTAITQSVSAK